MPLLDSIPTAGAGLTAGGASLMDQVNTGLMDVAKLKRYDEAQAKEDARAEQQLQLQRDTLEMHHQAQLWQQNQGEAQMLMGMYDEINDPVKFSQMWNVWNEKRGLPWGGLEFKQKTDEWDIFNTAAGRMIGRNKVKTNEDGSPIIQDFTPPDLKKVLDEDLRAEIEGKKQERAMKGRELEIRDAEMANRRKWIEVQNDKLESGEKVTAASMRFVFEQLANLRSMDEEDLTDEDREDMEFLEELKKTYFKQLSGKTAGKTGLMGDAAAGGTAQAGSDLPEGVTEEDIQFTMKKYGVSREEVLKKVGGGK